MSKRSLILLAVTVLALAGCGIPASEPHVAALPPSALGLAPESAPAIPSRWWTGFGDPQLDRIVGDATAGNPTLDAALARVRQAQAVLESQRANVRPDVTADVNPEAQRLSGKYIIPPPYGGSVRFVGTATANLTWDLDLFGRQRAAIDQARDTANAAAYDLRAAELALTGSVVQTYIDLARAEQQAAIAQRTIATREGSLRLVDVQVRNRLASQLQVQAAKTLLAQARGALVAAQGQRAVAADALAALAGHGVDYAAAIGPARIKLDGSLPLPDRVPADLLARRPDIAAAQARIAAAAAGRQVARRAFYPNINLTALAGIQAIGLGNVFSLDAGTAGAGPAIHLPLFEGGRLRADLAGATAAVDLATADYNDRVLGAVRDAADAIALIGNIEGQRQQARAVVSGFAETNRLNAIRVSSGLDSKLDLVDNDIRLLDAQLTETNLAADAARQRVALVMALGGDFGTRQDVRP